MPIEESSDVFENTVALGIYTPTAFRLDDLPSIDSEDMLPAYASRELLSAILSNSLKLPKSLVDVTLDSEGFSLECRIADIKIYHGDKRDGRKRKDIFTYVLLSQAKDSMSSFLRGPLFGTSACWFDREHIPGYTRQVVMLVEPLGISRYARQYKDAYELRRIIEDIAGSEHARK